MQKDKIYHIVVCALIAAIIALILIFSGGSTLSVCLGGFLGAMSAGLAKEYADSKQYGNHWCWWDLLCDLAGSLIGSLIGLISLVF